MHARALAPLLLCAALAACGGGDEETRKTTTGAEALPMPDAVRGSVTGMPNPGEATVVPVEVPEVPADPLDDGQPQDIASADPTADGTDAMPAVDEPGPDAAVVVLRDYYAALNAKDFARAHAAWRNAAQGAAQVADGLADVAGISVEIGPPGPIDAGAGQRFIEIPVRLDVTRMDGRLERHSGRYTLQRSVIEGGDPQWKIVRSSLSW